MNRGNDRLTVRMSVGAGERTVLRMDEQRCGRAIPNTLQAEATRLPPRLHRVLQEVLTGKAEKEIAADLELSRHTVHEYIKRIYAHLGVGSRSELLTRLIQ